MLILVTRPLPEAERTAASLARLGHSALIAPMLFISATDASFEADRYRGLVMTSGNAARALAAHPARSTLLSLPLFAVGRQTARAAKEFGFDQVLSADGDGADLVQLLVSRNAKGPLLYLAGSDRARDLPGDLKAHGVDVDTAVVYRADAAANLPQPAHSALSKGDVDGVLHFSRRTAAIFCGCLSSAGLTRAAKRVAHYCLSQRVSEPLVAAGIERVKIASTPDEDALLNLLPRA